MRLSMALFLIGSSVGLAGCAAGPDASRFGPPMLVATVWAMTLVGMATPLGFLARPMSHRHRATNTAAPLHGGPVYVGGGHDEDWRRRAWQNNAEAQRRQQEPQNAAVHHQQVQQIRLPISGKCGERGEYQQQVQQKSGYLSAVGAGECSELRRRVKQNRALVQQNAALYRQQVQQNTAIYQRQLLEAQQGKALGRR